MYIKQKRSIAKTITWRVTATALTVLLVWAFTKEIQLAFSIGLLEVVLKMLFYYVHERVWNMTGWGITSK